MPTRQQSQRHRTTIPCTGLVLEQVGLEIGTADCEQIDFVRLQRPLFLLFSASECQCAVFEAAARREAAATEADRQSSRTSSAAGSYDALYLDLAPGACRRRVPTIGLHGWKICRRAK